MNHLNEGPSRRRALGLAAGAAVVAVAGLARSAPARANQDGIGSLLAVTRAKVMEAAAVASELQGAEKQRALVKERDDRAGRISEAHASRVRSQALLAAHLREIDGNLAKLNELLVRC